MPQESQEEQVPLPRDEKKPDAKPLPGLPELWSWLLTPPAKPDDEPKQEPAQPRQQGKKQAPAEPDTEFLPAEPSEAEAPQQNENPQILTIPGLGTIRIQPKRKIAEELKNANPELIEVVMEHIYAGNQKELYKTAVARQDFDKLKEKLTSAELDKALAESFAKAEEEYDAKHSDVARATKKQAIALVSGYQERLNKAENPEREMIIIKSELYERNKEAAKLDAVLTSRLKLEYTLYPVTRGHSDIIANEAVDRVMNDVLVLRALGYEKEANQYHLDLLEHKAVRTAEDERKIHDLKHHQPRLKGGANKDIQAQVSLPEVVDNETLGVMAVPQLAAEVRRAIRPDVAAMISA